MTATIHTPSRWARRLVLIVTALGGSILTSQTAFAVDFLVNTANDTIDADLNNATCADQFGLCSLRAAIQQANKTSGKDTITLPAGTYSLSIEGRNENAAATGDLDITDSVDILGNGGAGTNGVNYTTISAGAAGTRDRVFHIASGNPTVTFTGLIITNGLTEENSGATIFNGAGVLIDSGTVTISDCRIQNNHVTGTTADFFTTLGGGIHVGTNGTLTLSNSIVSSNSALAGGGLSNQGTANIRSNTFITNNSAALGGGGGIANLGGYLNVGQATIDQNLANIGGGIYNEPQNGNSGATNIIGAAIEFNVAQAINGIDPDTQAAAEIGGFGGGIVNLGPMALQRSAVNENQTQNVAGTAVGADGGGIYNSALGNIDITNVTISKNIGRGGGGIFTTRNVTLTNVTIFNNKAEPCTLGGTCDARGATGGNQLSAYFSDPDNNAANRPDVIISNTILADGTYSNNNLVNGAAVGVCSGSTGYAAYITSNGYNISGDANCDLIAASDRTNLNNNTNPSLNIDESLQVNNAPPGATTKTHKLNAGSPAIDAIPGNVANSCPLIDQRNLLRDVCDIGAYESGAGTAAGNSYVDLKTTVTDKFDPATAGQQNTYTITVTNLYDSVDVSSVTLTINVPAQLQLNTVKPANTCSFANYTLTCTLGLIVAQDKKQIFIDVTPLVAGTITVTAEAAVTGGGQVDAFIANNTASQSTEVRGAENGSTNFSGTSGGGGTIGALLWIAAAGWSWRRFATKRH